MTKTNVAPKGRPHLDLAVRVRSWGWYQLVKEGLSLSDDGLDEKHVALKKAERPRLFFRIRTEGTSPTTFWGYHHDRKNFYAGVHENGRYPRAKAWFESPLWRLLTDPDLTPADFTEVIDGEIRRRNWFRATPKEASGGNWVFDGQEPAFRFDSKDGYQDMLRHLICLPDLEGIAVLCALFREAYFDFDIERAQQTRDAIFLALQQKIDSLDLLPIRVRKCLSALIEDRIIQKAWIRESDIPSTAAYEKLPRRHQIHHFISWYLSHDNPCRSYHSSRYPIVSNTDRTQWLRRNSSKVRKLWISARVVDASELYDEIDNVAGTKPADLARMHRRVSRLGKRIEFDEQRDERIRNQLRKLEPMPPQVDHPCLPVPFDAPELLVS